MANFLQITPFMWVPDVSQAVRFFVEGLNFTATVHFENYAYVERDGVAVRLCCASETPGESQPGTRAFRYYIDVKDVAPVLAEIGPRLQRLGHPGVAGPVDQEYGQREIMVLAPDGDLIVFGQHLFDTPHRG